MFKKVRFKQFFLGVGLTLLAHIVAIPLYLLYYTSPYCDDGIGNFDSTFWVNYFCFIGFIQLFYVIPGYAVAFFTDRDNMAWGIIATAIMTFVPLVIFFILFGLALGD